MRVYTDEQLRWIEDNLDAGVFRNQQHFTDVFNALFKTSVSRQAMATMLCNRGWSVKTVHNTNQWTPEMDAWLHEHYQEYENDFVRMADDFNAAFCTAKSNGCITKHLQRIGIHKPVNKSKMQNSGKFKTGQKSCRGELPIGTIRRSSTGDVYIKVKLCNGENTHGVGSHNYKEPWWKPLQKKVWEDNFGEVPEGYMVCSLSGNKGETDPNLLCLLDRRGSARMAKNGWWDADHPEIRRTAAAWCNLYYTVKDQE